MVNGPFESSRIVDNIVVLKEISLLTPYEDKRAYYNVISKNVISSALTLDEFYRVSICSSAK